MTELVGFNILFTGQLSGEFPARWGQSCTAGPGRGPRERALLPRAGHSPARGCGSAAPRLGPGSQPRGHPSSGDVHPGKREHSCSSPAELCLGNPKSPAHSPSPGDQMGQRWDSLSPGSRLFPCASMWASVVRRRVLPVKNPRGAVALPIQSLRDVAHGLGTVL